MFTALRRAGVLTPEWALVLMLPLFTAIAGGAMLHVARDFGFTALGEPAVSAPLAEPRGR